MTELSAEQRRAAAHRGRLMQVWHNDREAYKLHLIEVEGHDPDDAAELAAMGPLRERRVIRREAERLGGQRLDYWDNVAPTRLPVSR